MQHNRNLRFLSGISRTYTHTHMRVFWKWRGKGIRGSTFILLYKNSSRPVWIIYGVAGFWKWIKNLNYSFFSLIDKSATVWLPRSISSVVLMIIKIMIMMMLTVAIIMIIDSNVGDNNRNIKLPLPPERELVDTVQVSSYVRTYI